MKGELICEKCKGRDFGTFVHYGSWILTCLNCKVDGPATSFIAVAPNLSGNFEAIVVDKDLNHKETIFRGDVKKGGIEIIRTEAQKGNRIFIKKVE